MNKIQTIIITLIYGFLTIGFFRLCSILIDDGYGYAIVLTAIILLAIAIPMIIIEKRKLKKYVKVALGEGDKE